MAIVKQGGFSPNTGQVTTSMGLREPRPQVCTKCRERKQGQLYTIDPNGGVVCGDCSGSMGEGILRGVCDEAACACHSTEVDVADPS